MSPGTRNQLCPKCGEPVGGHTVDGLSECLSPLYDHDLPMQSLDQAQHAQVDAVWAGSIAVKAGVHKSAIGIHPVLLFEFSGPDATLPAIALLLDDTHMRSVRTLVGDAVDLAVKQARRAR